MVYEQDRVQQRFVEQNSLTFQFLQVVVGGVGRGGLQGFSQRQNSTADLEQHVDIPARVGLHGFLPGQSSSSSSHLLVNADEGIQGGFSHFFPVREKVRGWVRTRGRN